MTNWIIIILVGLIGAIGGLSFFFSPAYEKGVWIVLGALSSSLGSVLGFKFGVTLPGQENGKTTEPSPVASRSDVAGSDSSRLGISGNAN